MKRAMRAKRNLLWGLAIALVFINAFVMFASDQATSAGELRMVLAMTDTYADASAQRLVAISKAMPSESRSAFLTAVGKVDNFAPTTQSDLETVAKAAKDQADKSRKDFNSRVYEPQTWCALKWVSQLLSISVIALVILVELPRQRSQNLSRSASSTA